MRQRTLGRSDLELPVVIAGAWAIGGGPYWGETDEDQAVDALRVAMDHGIDAIDTAPIYGLGHSERVVGKAIAGRRNEVKVLTKVGLRWDREEGDLFFENKNDDGSVFKIYRNGRPDSVKAEVDASLERLGIDCIDLLQVHWPDPTTPIAETMGALADVRAAGKIREIGVSNFTPDLLEQAQVALGDVPLASDQPKYSLVARGMETGVLPWAREHHVGVLVYSPLEQGLLTGKVRGDRHFEEGSGRDRRPTFRPANRDAVNRVLDTVVQPIADAHGSTLAQTIIAWTVGVPGITAALVGVRTPEQAIENAGAGDLLLTDEEFVEIDEAFEALKLDLSAD